MINPRTGRHARPQLAAPVDADESIVEDLLLVIYCLAGFGFF